MRGSNEFLGKIKSIIDSRESYAKGLLSSFRYLDYYLALAHRENNEPNTLRAAHETLTLSARTLGLQYGQYDVNRNYPLMDGFLRAGAQIELSDVNLKMYIPAWDFDAYSSRIYQILVAPTLKLGDQGLFSPGLLIPSDQDMRYCGSYLLKI